MWAFEHVKIASRIVSYRSLAYFSVELKVTDLDKNNLGLTISLCDYSVPAGNRI